MRTVPAVTPACALVVALACASPEPAVQEGPGAEITFDGLHRVDHAAFQKVWVRPRVSLAGYQKVWLVYSGFAYKSPPRRRGPYPLTPRQVERLERALREVFVEELTRDGGWEMAEGPGPDVLMVRAALIDVEVKAPPEPESPLDRVFIDSAGEATLVLELYDAQSREILARAADRRSAEPAGSIGMRNLAISNQVEVRRTLRRWARILRDRLDAAKELDLGQAYRDE